MSFAVVGSLFPVDGKSGPGRVAYRLGDRLYGTEHASVSAPLNFNALIGSATTVAEANKELDRWGWSVLTPLRDEDVRRFLDQARRTREAEERAREGRVEQLVVAANILDNDLRFVVSGADGRCHRFEWRPHRLPEDPVLRVCRLARAADSWELLSRLLRDEGGVDSGPIAPNPQAWQLWLYGRETQPALLTGCVLEARKLLFTLDEERHTVGCAKYFAAHGGGVRLDNYPGSVLAGGDREVLLGELVSRARAHVEREWLPQFRGLEPRDLQLVYSLLPTVDGVAGPREEREVPLASGLAGA